MKNDTKLKSMLTSYRRDLHRIPELGFDLESTSEYITAVLRDTDCTMTPVAQSGICAFFDFGADHAIAFRSDMDALPIEENTGVSFSSVHPRAMHACGHDGHMSMLLAFARILQTYLDEKRPIKHNVLLIFQPAEETTGGAKIICKSGVFKEYNIKAVFGIHMWPYIDAGVLASRPGPMMAKSSEINIDIEGKSAHCTAAEEGIDALRIGCSLLNKIYDMPEVADDAPSILKFGKMYSGDVRNAISPHTRIEGTLRCLDLETFDIIVANMEAAARSYEKSYDCSINVAHSEGYPPVTNDPPLYKKVLTLLTGPAQEKDALKFIPLKEPSMIAEDFSFYQQKVPGVFMYLGTGTGIPLHSTDFDFDESVLINGVKSYIALLNIEL